MLTVPYILLVSYLDWIFMIKWMAYLFLFGMLILLMGARPATKVGSDATALRCLATVDSLMAANQLEKAIEVVTGCQKDFEANPRWSYQFADRLAISWLRNGQAELALPLLEERVRSHSSEARAHRNLGACLLVLGRRGRALSEYQQVVELDPLNSSGHLEYGQILLDFRVYDEAEKEILTAASLCGNCLEVQPVLAQYYQMTGQPAKAATHWRALWTESGQPVARQNLLVALLASKNDQEVMNLILEEPLPKIPLAELQQLVAAEGRLGQSQQSLLFIDFLQSGSAAREWPDEMDQDSLFWGQISHNLLMAAHYTEALLAVDKAISLSGENIVYLNNRVVILQKMQRFEEADQQWEKLLLLDPSLKGKQSP